MRLEEAREEFLRCWPWLDAALEQGALRHNGTIWKTHNIEHVWQRIIDGRSYFWPSKNCAIITEFYVSPTGLKSHHNWLAGGELDEIVAMMPKVEGFGRDNGSHRQTGSGRRGWLRAFTGYEEIGVRRQKSFLGG